MESFVNAARSVGADVQVIADFQELATYLKERTDGPILYPSSPSLDRTGLAELLSKEGMDVIKGSFREHGATAAAGLTGANFAFAETGTVVLESSDESVRIATTLPEKHFVVLDPAKILASADAGVPFVKKFHDNLPQAYLAYITGPSRTADIERVLTIGVHGPAELHILLLDGLSDDPMER